MRFRHADPIWQQHPELVAGVLHVQGVRADADVSAAAARHLERAQQRLAAAAEGDWPEIQAWRRAFSRMGLKPTQYRCAAEALLRRLRRDGTLPPLHPIIDLCNALSAATATPIAVFDTAQIAGGLEVRPAVGGERYLAFSGEVEPADAGEIIFADEAGQAHARRWCHRQSAQSAVRPGTSAVLIVAESHHASARADMQRLVQSLGDELLRLGWTVATSKLLRADDRELVL
jgi:DNA/RNA-binding domain of Phe-tRNA-synthetase-like protein